MANRIQWLSRRTPVVQNLDHRVYGRRHQAWRLMVLRRHPVCADPDGRHPGQVKAAEIADHRIPIKEGGDFSLENGQGLCKSCHAFKSAREGLARRGIVS